MAAEVLIAGGGMAGLTAAIAAAESGAAVRVLEKGDRIGGSAALSGGLVWTEPDLKRLRERNPLGNPGLNRVLVERFDESLEWLLDCGVTMTEPLESLFGTGRGRRIQPDMDSFVETMARRAEDLGVVIETDEAVEEILTDDRARAVGVKTRTPGGFIERPASAVILATGGFPAGTEKLARYVTPNADRLVRRCNPWSTGDGLDAGIGAGGSVSGGLHAFYGHLVAAPPARIEPADFIGLTQYYSVHCLLVNRHGNRFVDETEADELNAQALSRQPGALGFIVLDADLAGKVTAPATAGFPEVDRHGEIRRVGGRVLEAETLEALAGQIDSAGGNGWRTRRTVEEFNELVLDHPERLPVPRARRHHRIDRAPFVAVPVVPAVTLTDGGLRIDEDARVLDRSGRPIERLFAAGADAGGIYIERYAGGLSMSLVFGRIAGASAAREGEA